MMDDASGQDADFLTEDGHPIADHLPPQLLPGYTRLRAAFAAAKRVWRAKSHERMVADTFDALYRLKDDLPPALLADHAFRLDPRGHEVRISSRDHYFRKEEGSGAFALPLERLLGACSSSGVGITAAGIEALRKILLGSETESLEGKAALRERPLRLAAMHDVKCRRCGHGPFCYVFDGERLWVDEPCAYAPDWTLQVEIDVPSGLLYVGPDVDRLFRVYGDMRVPHPYSESPRMDEESLAYFEERAHAYAALGCATLRIGAAQPLWYAHVDDLHRFTIARARDSQDTGVPAHLKRVRAITKDVGSLYVADFDLVRHLWKGPKPLSERYAVTLPPGRYRFTHHLHKLGFKRGWRGQDYRRYTDVERIGPAHAPPPPPERTAGQVWQHALRDDVPILPDDYTRFRVLERIFCNGNQRYRWRPEGYPQFLNAFPATEPEAELPPLDTMVPCLIEPESAIVGIATGAIPVNPSMRAFARRFLACVAQHGVLRYAHGKWRFNRQVCAQQQALARDLLARLDARYPPEP